MLSSSQYNVIKLFKTTSPQKLFDYDCVTLHLLIGLYRSKPATAGKGTERIYSNIIQCDAIRSE